MSRSLVLGNGNVLVCYDEWGQVRDFHFPHVGLENHVGEHLMHRIGIHVDGVMHWFSDGAFDITIAYEQGTLVANVCAVHKSLNIELHFSDIVYNEHDIFVRHVEVHNTGKSDRNIKLFFNQQFHISESQRGDTAYYSPELHAIVHYKGRRVFLVSARSDDAYFDDYSVGLLGIEGKEGTWRDAEDGVLSKSGIEHGSVDSVLGLSLAIPAGEMRQVSYWVAAAETYRCAERYHQDILSRGPDHLKDTTRDFWKAWVNRNEFEGCNIDKKYIDLYHSSLLVMRAHTDRNGAIIASGDSSILQSGRDTYNYCWPRDAAHIVSSYIKAGHLASATKFAHFCDGILTDDGYLLHKYRPDKSLGSSWHPWVRDGRAQPPIQEDETAITLVTLREQYEVSRDVEFIENIYNSYIKRVADFMYKYRDKKSGLPLPSHDLWEEQFGTFTYTSASVYAGLKAAAEFSRILGKQVAERRWSSAAEEVKDGILTKLLHEDGRVVKSLQYAHFSPEPDYTADASSFYGLFRFGVLDIDDPRLRRVYDYIKDRLTVHTDVGGIARYEGDNYFRTSNDVPGNPWIITTLWLTEYEILKAKNKRELTQARSGLEWTLKHSTNSGMLSEQYDAVTGAPVSVAPLVWSHAQYVLTFLAYMKRLEDFGLCPSEKE